MHRDDLLVHILALFTDREYLGSLHKFLLKCLCQARKVYIHVCGNVNGHDFTSVYAYSIRFLNCSDIMLFLVFHFFQ